MAESKQAKDERLNKQCDERVAAGLAKTKEFIKIWQDALNYCFDNPLYNKKREQGWDRIWANYIYPGVQQTLALVVERRADIIAEPVDDEDADGARFNQRLLQRQYDRELDMPMQNVRAALDGMLFGYYVGKVRWNKHAHWVRQEHRWEGGPELNLTHPIYFGADPEAETMDNAGFVYGRRRVRTVEMVNAWPQFASQIKAAAEAPPSEPWVAVASSFVPYSDQRDAGPGESMDGAIANLLSAGRRQTETHADSVDGTQRSAYVTVEEIYWRDPETFRNWDVEKTPAAELMAQGTLDYRDSIPYHVESGAVMNDENWPRRVKDGLEWDEPKYPDGRFVVRVGDVGHQTILNAELEQQIWPYRRWPYLVGQNAILPHIWQGLNSVVMSRGMQDWKNVTMACMAAHAKLFAVPPVIVETDTVDGAQDNVGLAKKLKRAPGAIWKVLKNRAKGISIPDMPTIGTGLMAFSEAVAKDLRDNFGMQQIGLGREGKPKTATEARDLLQSSHQRVGLQLFLEDRWILAVMEHVAELNQRMLSPGQKVRLAASGKGARVPQTALQAFGQVLAEMGVMDVEAVLAEVVRRRQPERNMVMVPDGAFDVNYDLKLQVSTDVPIEVGRQQKKEDYLEIFKLLISSMPGAAAEILPDILRTFDFEDADALAERIQQRLMMEQQAAAAQQQEQEGMAQPVAASV